MMQRHGLKWRVGLVVACVASVLGLGSEQARAQHDELEHRGTLTYSVRYSDSDFFAAGRVREDVRSSRDKTPYKRLGGDAYLSVYARQINGSALAGYSQNSLSFAAYVEDDKRSRYLNKELRVGYERVELQYTCVVYGENFKSETIAREQPKRSTHNVVKTKFHGDDWNASNQLTDRGQLRVTSLISNQNLCSNGYISDATVTISYIIKAKPR